MTRNYLLVKNKFNKEIAYIDYDRVSGFKFKPVNKGDNTISVNQMVIISPTFIEKVLTRKTKRKLELYLEFIVKLLDEDESCKLLISFADLCVWKKIKFLSELDVREQGIKAYIEVWNCLFLSLFLLSKLLSFLSENYADFETNLENVRKQRQSDLQRLKSTSDDLKKELHRRAVEFAHNFLNKK